MKSYIKAGVEIGMKITSAISIVGIFAAIVSGGLYFAESKHDSSNNGIYYGTMTEKLEFTYPERIILATFGESDKEYQHLDFVNELFCAPVGSDLIPHKIASRFVIVNEFSFTNKLPDSIPQSSRTSNGLTDDDRAIMRDSNDVYVTWAMDDLKPEISSDCYVQSKVTGFTPIFKLPVKHTHQGNMFRYIVPE